MKFCPKCGHPIEKENANFCKQCGEPLHENEVSEKESEKKVEKKKRRFKVPLVIIGVILVLVIIYVKTLPSSSEQTDTSSSSSIPSSEVVEDKVTAEEISSNDKAILSAALLYADENLWPALEFAYKAEGNRSEKAPEYDKGGDYTYGFASKENMGGGRWPSFIPSSDNKEIYFYNYGSSTEPCEPEDHKTAEELATYINDTNKVEEYRNLVQRMTING